MVIELCQCSWGIPGVEQLPAHMHWAWALVVHNGRELTIRQHDVALNPKCVVLDQGDDIRIAVNWKDIVRASR